MKQFLLLSAFVVYVSSAAVAPSTEKCNLAAGNSRKDRLQVEAFCNDPESKTSGNALLQSFANKWSWSYMPVVGLCQRQRIEFNGTDHLYTDANGKLQLTYVEVDGVVFRDQPESWHCGNVSTNFYPLDSSPDHNLILQVNCVASGYEYNLIIDDYSKVTQSNREELTGKYGFDLKNMDNACATLGAPSS